MKSNNRFLSFMFVLATSVVMSACSGGGGGDEAVEDRGTGEPTHDVVTTAGRITGLWGGSTQIVVKTNYSFLVADQGTTASVYDCIEHSLEDFDVTGTRYDSRHLDKDGGPALSFIYVSDDAIMLEVGSDVPFAFTINSADVLLDKIEINKFSLNSTGNAPSLAEVRAVCGDAIEDNGAANVIINATYGDEILEFSMIFRGGADADNINSIGSEVSASMKSARFQSTLVTDKVEFTAGSITFDVCDETLASGHYSFSSEQGDFSGDFSLNNPGMDVCAEIDLYSIGTINEVPVTAPDDCTATSPASGLTGTWTIDNAQKIVLRGGISLIDGLDGFDSSGLINASLILMDNVDTLGMTICELLVRPAELANSGDSELVARELNELFVGDTLIGSIDVRSNDVLAVDLNGLPDWAPTIIFRKRSRVGNSACMTIAGMGKFPAVTVSCIDKPMIKLEDGVANTELTMAVISGGHIYRIHMNLGNNTIQRGTYTVAPEGASVIISSVGLVDSFPPDGDINFDSGSITIIEKGRNHVKGSLELFFGGGQRFAMDFNSNIY
ncbi:MAG: hypothetical protein JKY67_16650 [Pseudomonadales bacterium]|nr:hypothetical protein [Pseudomonadales bacterium]